MRRAHPPRWYRRPAIECIAGIILLPIAGIALLVGLGAFTASAPLPPWLSLIGVICFYSWIWIGAGGVFLTIHGAVRWGNQPSPAAPGGFSVNAAGGPDGVPDAEVVGGGPT